MFPLLFTLTADPITTLYGAQAVTYACAAHIVHAAGHGLVWRVYALSALLHTGFMLCHALHA